jgi:hypothetical protein
MKESNTLMNAFCGRSFVCGGDGGYSNQGFGGICQNAHRCMLVFLQAKVMTQKSSSSLKICCSTKWWKRKLNFICGNIIKEINFRCRNLFYKSGESEEIKLLHHGTFVMQSGDHEDIKFPSCNNLVYKVVLSVQK